MRFIVVLLVIIAVIVESKTADVISKSSRRTDIDDWKKVLVARSPASVYRNQMLMNYAGMGEEEVSNRIESMVDPADETNGNKSLILSRFLNGLKRKTQNLDFLDENEPADLVSSSGNELEPRHRRDPDEIMETAEVYFRPLSRYRELQERKKNQTESKAQNGFQRASDKKYTLLSKSPEYCLPARGGVICFYKV